MNRGKIDQSLLTISFGMSEVGTFFAVECLLIH
jgi:hypothetical protein